MRSLVACTFAILTLPTHPIAADPLSWGAVVTQTANGCDAFTPVRGPDGHHYTSFGDCGGLTGKLAKLSMGFGRIIGGPADARVQDLPTRREGLSWTSAIAMLARKPSSAIIVGKRMYIWVRNYGPNGTQARLKYSDNFTRNENSHWTWAPVILTNFGYPVFVQGAPGNYVYIVAHDNNSAYVPADRFVLLRVPAEPAHSSGPHMSSSAAHQPIRPGRRPIRAARRSSRRQGNVTGPAFPSARHAAATTGGRGAATAWPATASRSGRERTPGARGGASSIRPIGT